MTRRTGCSQAVDKQRVEPHDAVSGAQHPQKPEVFKWKKFMDDFFHGLLECLHDARFTPP